jgi:hypothetical protein
MEQSSNLYVSAMRAPGKIGRYFAGIYVLWAGPEAPAQQKGGRFTGGANTFRVAVLQELEWRQFRAACGCPGFTVRPGTCKEFPVKYARPEVSP